MIKNSIALTYIVFYLIALSADSARVYFFDYASIGELAKIAISFIAVWCIVKQSEIDKSKEQVNNDHNKQQK